MIVDIVPEFDQVCPFLHLRSGKFALQKAMERRHYVIGSQDNDRSLGPAEFVEHLGQTINRLCERDEIAEH
ncbi:hypothetical protein [Mesorhizobium cantuariense]|uniref:Uncharacterized protein n=1 Tax=Mesorhizobium cantuariense TaxID=1300275 RepID=A0ABV7MTB8_9HYPH